MQKLLNANETAIVAFQLNSNPMKKKHLNLSFMDIHMYKSSLEIYTEKVIHDQNSFYNRTRNVKHFKY